MFVCCYGFVNTLIHFWMGTIPLVRGQLCMRRASPRSSSVPGHIVFLNYPSVTLTRQCTRFVSFVSSFLGLVFFVLSPGLLPLLCFICFVSFALFLWLCFLCLVSCVAEPRWLSLVGWASGNLGPSRLGNRLEGLGESSAP